MTRRFRPLRTLAATAFALLAGVGAASSAPSLLVDLDSGDVLEATEATRNWYPASITKLMTAYVALSAVREGRVSLDTPMIVSPRAARMAPSKMGFKPGSEITLDNALKIIMVKSANDVSVTIAEGLGGSVEGFAELMNDASAKLGMTQSNWSNPNGLPDSRQVTSARDMALLARALHREFPEARGLWSIGAIQFGQRYMPNHNALIGRYPGADGMKTGFTCAAGFNVVATASRGGRRLLAVVMGQPSASQRTAYTAALFDRGFARPAAIATLQSMGGGGVGGAPDMRPVACGRRPNASVAATDSEDVAEPVPAYAASVVENNPQLEFLFSQSGGTAQGSVAQSASAYARGPRPRFEPVPVYLGRAPGWSGPAVGPRGVAAVSAGSEGPGAGEASGEPARKARASAKAKAMKPAAKTARVIDEDEAPARLKPGKSAGKPVAAKPTSAKPVAAKAVAAKPAPAKTKADTKTKAEAKTTQAATLAKPAPAPKPAPKSSKPTASKTPKAAE